MRLVSTRRARGARSPRIRWDRQVRRVMAACGAHHRAQLDDRLPCCHRGSQHTTCNTRHTTCNMRHVWPETWRIVDMCHSIAVNAHRSANVSSLSPSSSSSSESSSSSSSESSPCDRTSVNTEFNRAQCCCDRTNVNTDFNRAQCCRTHGMLRHAATRAVWKLNGPGSAAGDLAVERLAQLLELLLQLVDRLVLCAHHLHPPWPLADFRSSVSYSKYHDIYSQVAGDCTLSPRSVSTDLDH